MSDKGGSDLDVFKSLRKSHPQHHQTLVGVAAAPPPGVPDPNHAPPPPPSLRAAPAPGEGNEFSIEADMKEVQPLDDIEEVDAIGEGEFGFRDDETTNVFSLPAQPTRTAYAPDENPYQYSEPAWSPAAPITAPKDYAAPKDYIAPAYPASPSLPAPPPAPSFPGHAYQQPGMNAPPPQSFPPAGAYPGSPSYPPAPPPAPPQVSIGDWEDEDDKTTVYTRENMRHPGFSMLGTAVPAPSVVPGAPPPPMSRPSAPIPMQPTPAVPLPRPSPLPRDVYPPASVPPTTSGSRTSWLVGGTVVLALLGALIYTLLPRSGNLVVTVAGPGNKPLDKVEVIVDDKLVCSASPCTVADLSAGTHLVRARAAGYQATADTAVPITGGQDAVHNVKLDPDKGTGVTVTGVGPGLTLWIDGKEIGTLPQEVNDLAPGSHRLKVTGEAYVPHEETVDVPANELLSVGPLKLQVAKGLARIMPGDNAQGARIVLETGTDRKAIPRLPINLQVDTSKTHVLVATKAGFEEYRQELTFPDGEPERMFTVALQPGESEEVVEEPAAEVASAPARRSVSRAPSRPARAPARAPAPAPAPDPAPASASATGTLNINAVPRASVILDGKPIGSTPKIGVSVSAGNHSVIFVKDGERVTKSVTVQGGGSATVVHRF